MTDLPLIAHVGLRRRPGNALAFYQTSLACAAFALDIVGPPSPSLHWSSELSGSPRPP